MIKRRAESLNEQEYGSKGEQRAESREQCRAQSAERRVQSAECSELAAGVAAEVAV